MANPEILILAGGIINSAVVLIHVIVDERYKSGSARREAELVKILRELAAINNAYLPWVYDKMSQDERLLVETVINGYKG